MSYGVVLAPDAIEDLARLPPAVQNFVETEIRRLASDPTGMSRPAHFPYLPGQMYQTQVTHDDVAYYVTVLFRYSQDEQSIEIFGIGTIVVGDEEAND